jgi:hypothetical protein
LQAWPPDPFTSLGNIARAGIDLERLIRLIVRNRMRIVEGLFETLGEHVVEAEFAGSLEDKGKKHC